MHTPIGSVNGSINNQQQSSTYGSSPPAVSNLLNNAGSPRAFLSAQDLLPPKQGLGQGQRSPSLSQQDPYAQQQNLNLNQQPHSQYEQFGGPQQQTKGFGYEPQQMPQVSLTLFVLW